MSMNILTPDRTDGFAASHFEQHVLALLLIEPAFVHEIKDGVKLRKCLEITLVTSDFKNAPDFLKQPTIVLGSQIT
tara:strand:- start:35179 stop:35406 length:228 start_codon:yes stop_codon:yes gene_type:complete